MLRLAVLSAATLVITEARRFALTAQFDDATCEGQPTFVQVNQVANCTVRKCADSSLVSCTSELSCHDDIVNLFDSAPYILRESYSDNNCSEFQSAQAFNAPMNCVKNEATGRFVLTKQENNGSISVHYFLEAMCSTESLHSVDYVSKEALEDHSCDTSGQKWYMSSARSRALELKVDGSSATDTTLGIDTPSTISTTSLKGDDSSTTGAETSTTGMSSESSSTDTFAPEVDTATSEAVNSTVTSSDSSSNDDDTGSSSESTQKASSRSNSTKSRSSPVSITTAPELDTATVASSATGSVDENFAADASTSGSNTPTTVASTKSNIGIGSGTIVGIVMGSLIVVIVVIGSIIRRRNSDDYDVQSHSNDPYWGQTSPINWQLRTQKR